MKQSIFIFRILNYASLGILAVQLHAGTPTFQSELFEKGTLVYTDDFDGESPRSSMAGETGRVGTPFARTGKGHGPISRTTWNTCGIRVGVVRHGRFFPGITLTGMKKTGWQQFYATLSLRWIFSTSGQEPQFWELFTVKPRFYHLSGWE